MYSLENRIAMEKTLCAYELLIENPRKYMRYWRGYGEHSSCKLCTVNNTYLEYYNCKACILGKIRSRITPLYQARCATEALITLKDSLPIWGWGPPTKKQIEEIQDAATIRYIELVVYLEWLGYDYDHKQGRLKWQE